MRNLIISLFLFLLLPIVAFSATSTTEGVKFPDGTFQTTTASAGAGWSTVGTALSPTTISNNVGIGTTVAGFNLEVKTGGGNNLRLTNTASSSSSAGSQISMYSDDGAALASGDRLAQISLGGSKDNAHTLANANAVSGWATEAWSGSATGSEMRLETTTNGGTTRTARVYVRQDGNVGIAQASPTQKFEVAGGLRVVNATSNFTVKSGANTACNTTCSTSMCNVAFDTTAGVYTMVSCSDATADICSCLGA